MARERMASASTSREAISSAACDVAVTARPSRCRSAGHSAWQAPLGRSSTNRPAARCNCAAWPGASRAADLSSTLRTGLCAARPAGRPGIHQPKLGREPFRLHDEKWFAARPVMASTKKVRSYLDSQLLPAFGDVPLKDVDRFVVQQWVETLVDPEDRSKSWPGGS